ncbi:hypothetical protein ACI09V_004314 [Cronobacter dublinensis]
MNIKNSIINLARNFKLNDQNMGAIEYTDCNNNVKSTVSLRGELDFFYHHLTLKDKPTLDGVFFMHFIEPSELKNILSGWNTDDNTWSETYVIFAERNGDVLFCDTTYDACTVYGSIQKRNFIIANSLASFLDALNSAIDVERDEYNGEVFDDDFNVEAGFIDDVKNTLSKNLDEKEIEGFMRFFFS